MFTRTRIALTAWYLLIIMLISASFSVVIYRGLSTELDRIERITRLRIERGVPPPFATTQAPTFVVFDSELIHETKGRIVMSLLVINAIILAGAAAAGYFLAGKTLKPISDMVEEQNRFITDSSHELRTPLTSLKSEIEVNLRNPHLELGQAKKLLQSNLEEVNKLQILSDSLIRLTQYQKGNKNLSQKNVSIQDVLTHSIQKISNAAREKSIGIKITGPDASVNADKQSLMELFVILLDNAIKYSKQRQKISISLGKNKNQVTIDIVDRGIGIHHDDIPHIFDRFYRADKSRSKTSIPGYGLGLAIAKQIVQRHQGSISVKSSFGHGTTFTVSLPIKSV